MKQLWSGVIPAITTPFLEDLSLDLESFGRHCLRLAEAGCTGVVIAGSLGEGGSLTMEEKASLLRMARAATGRKLNLMLGVAAMTTAEAVRIARMAHEEGADGLMVLPPYVYCGDWRENKAHVAAVFSATPLPCMLYNNPIAYRVDYLPEQVAELRTEHGNFQAIKESSADVRRLAALRSVLGGRLELLCGVDDLIVEAVAAGAVGWIAGLVNAFPEESVALFQLAGRRQDEPAFELYRWFLPLLRMDTVPKFVHLIKLMQQEMGMGNERLRPPRLSLDGRERELALRTLRAALDHRPPRA